MEADVVDQSSCQLSAEIDDDLVVNAQLGRVALNKAISMELDKPTSKQVSALCTKKATALQHIDRDIDVDMGVFYALQGSGGEDRLTTLMWRCFPTDAVKKSYQDCLKELTLITESAIYYFCGTGPQKAVIAIKSMVTALSTGGKPQLECENNKLSAEAGARLAYFLRHEWATPDGQSRSLAGKAAADYLYEALEAKVNADEQYGLEDLKVGQFFWLLPPEHVANLQTWTVALFGSDRATGVAPEPGAKKKNAAKAAATSAALDASVSSLFA